MDWNYIEMCWRDAKMKQEAESRLSMELHNTANPYLRTVTLLEQCLKQSKGKPTKTPMNLLNILEKHSSSHDHFLNHNVRTAALDVVLRQKNSAVINKVCVVYRLCESSLEFLPVVKSLIEEKKYNEACLLATALCLQEHFTIQDMAIPLFLQDKIQNVENYFKGNRELQIQFLLFLDGLLLDSKKPFSVASSLGVPNIKSEKLYAKTIGKLIARLLKQYDIPPDTCPNLCQVRGMGALKYLINRRFSEGTVDDENWSDLLLGAVGNNKELQRELLVQLVTYNEAQEALRWALHFQVERHLWPPVLENILIESIDKKSLPEESSVVPQAPEQKEEVWELEDIAYLPFRLDRSDIIIVETVEGFLNCIHEIQNYDVLALDGEWKPSFGMQQEKLSLLQLAIWDAVFLLDVLALQKLLDKSHWQLFIDQVICNSHITKLSYGFTSDIQQLVRIVPSARTKLQNIENMYDFATLYPKLYCPELLVSSVIERARAGPQDSKGLSNLTFTVLGLPLDKSMQFSDWDKRPLREPQILYAAVDAFCLLQIFEAWHKRATEMEQDFFALAQRAKSSLPSTSPQKGKSHKQKKELPFREQLVLSYPESHDLSKPVMAVTELRVVVDTMLQGLGKHLRLCGVDTHILETEDYHDEAAKVAQRQGRVILTSGAPYQQLKQYVPAGHCLNIPNGLTAQEQAHIVFRHFNVQLHKEDIFSRCSACNGGQYVHIPCQDLHQMWMKYKNLDFIKQALTDQSQSEVLYDGGVVDINRAVIGGKVSIVLHQLNSQVFERVTIFYVCATCGKVYWEGSHHGRVLKKLTPLMVNQESKEELNPLPTESPVEVSKHGNPPGPSNNSREELSTSARPKLPPPPEMFYSSDDGDDFNDEYIW